MLGKDAESPELTPCAFSIRKVLALQNPGIPSSVATSARFDGDEHRRAIVYHFCATHVKDPTVAVVLNWLDFSSTEETSDVR